jgi:dCMP deaminase
MTRPDWDEYFLAMVPQIGSRGTCNRGKSGAIFTQDRRIVATGYVGAPPGFPHCDDAGHEFIFTMQHTWDEPVMHCVRTIHAEQNGILDAASRGIALGGSTMYCTMEPCKTCAMMLVAVKCVRVVAISQYHAAAETRKIFEHAGIVLDVIRKEEKKYE